MLTPPVELIMVYGMRNGVPSTARLAFWCWCSLKDNHWFQLVSTTGLGTNVCGCLYSLIILTVPRLTFFPSLRIVSWVVNWSFSFPAVPTTLRS